MSDEVISVYHGWPQFPCDDVSLKAIASQEETEQEHQAIHYIQLAIGLLVSVEEVSEVAEGSRKFIKHTGRGEHCDIATNDEVSTATQNPKAVMDEVLNSSWSGQVTNHYHAHIRVPEQIAQEVLDC